MSEMNVLMLPGSAIETGSNPLSAGRDGSESRPSTAVLNLEALKKSIVISANIWYDNHERRAISYAQIQTSE